MPSNEPPQPPSQTSTRWPAGLQDYVRRAFAEAPEGVYTTKQIEEELKILLRIDKTELGRMNWSTLALPHENIIQKQKAALASSGPYTMPNQPPYGTNMSDSAVTDRLSRGYSGASDSHSSDRYSRPSPDYSTRNNNQLHSFSSETPSYGTAPIIYAGDQQYSQANGSTYNANRFVAGPKRKSQDGEGPSDRMDEDESIPPWRKANKKNVLEDSSPSKIPFADRVQKRQKTTKDWQSSKSATKAEKEKRKQRFEAEEYAVVGARKYREDTPPPSATDGPVIGRCETLEKSYLRLTSAPNPDKVRPLHILKQTLELLKKKWKKEKNYSYICDQFKSLRQDLTVQHIKNETTVLAYEAHARIALEMQDVGEYNQCQTQLRALYANNIGGSALEFKAYEILYGIYTGNGTAMNDTLASLKPEEKLAEGVKHALDCRSALALGNYHRFFRLYLDPPAMGGFVLDLFVERERYAALAIICKT
jgi:SAC3/GANP family